MRFHHALTFVPVEEFTTLARTCDELGYAGLYLSDHLFNPAELESHYTYAKDDDGAPSWEKSTAWPDPMCTIASLAAITSQLTFTTGVYIAPVRDLITVAKTVGTTAAFSANRVRLGVGVGWCKEEFDQTGQDFATRGKRLDEMIPALRALWSGGWVEYHGTYYDVPPCQMNPSPSEPVPILGGGHSAPAFRRAAQLCDGWIAAGAYSEVEALGHLDTLAEYRRAAGREHEPYAIYLSLRERPSVDLYRRMEERGVTDMICAPWWFARIAPGATAEQAIAARIQSATVFAEHYVAKMTDN
jgi:probable F420-dependent oxidoreductase